MIPALALLISVACVAAVVCLESVWCQIPRLRPVVSAIEVAIMAAVWALVVLGIAVFSGCREPDPTPEDTASDTRCWGPDDVRAWCVDDDRDGVGGVGRADRGTTPIWYCDDVYVLGRVPCDPTGYDCDDHNPEETWPNPGIGGGCDGQPEETP